MSPLQRTLKKLRAEGYLTEKVERTVPKSFIKQDLFEIADILAIRADGLVLFVQVTDIDHNADHVKKLNMHKNSRFLRDAGMAIEVWAWRKLKKGGWQPKITTIDGP